MILFFMTPSKSVIATAADHQLSQDEINELCWLYGGATLIEGETVEGFFVGPRREMITPWSTNAVEITQNMSLHGISRIEEYFPVSSKDADHDPMLQRMYEGLDQTVFTIPIDFDHEGVCTANWKGYYVTYFLENRSLYGVLHEFLNNEDMRISYEHI